MNNLQLKMYTTLDNSRISIYRHLINNSYSIEIKSFDNPVEWVHNLDSKQVTEQYKELTA